MNVYDRVSLAYSRFEVLGHLELDELFDWLDKEQDSGAYNMLGANVTLLRRWHNELRDKKEASLVLKAWKECR